MTDQTSNNYWDIGDEAKGELSGIGAAEFKPPIDCMYLWWKNGAGAYSTIGGVPYFGGWMTSEDDIELANSIMGKRPEKWSAYDLVGKSGNPYRAWGSRYVAVAPIGMRRRWVNADPQNNVNAHGQMNILCYMADVIHKDNTAIYDPYFPVVLSAKSMSANFVKQSLADFDRATASARYQFAGGNPSSAFWAVIGTFSDKPNTIMVGKKQKSAITPCSCFLPSQITEDTLKTIFVNSDIKVTKLMVELKQQCKDWLHAWDGQTGNRDQESESGNGGHQSDWAGDAPPF